MTAARSQNRVLLVTPYPPERDGQASYARDLAHALSGRLDVDIATQPGYEADVEDEGAAVHRVISSAPATVRRLIDTIDRVRPNVIRLQLTVLAWGVQVIWLLLAVGRVRRSDRHVTVVWTLHEVVREIDLLRFVGRALYRTICRLADVCVVHSERSAERLVDPGALTEDRILTTPHGVLGRSKVESVDRRDGPVVFFGYLHPDKGVEHLLSAMTVATAARQAASARSFARLAKTLTARYEAAGRNRTASGLPS